MRVEGCSVCAHGRESHQPHFLQCPMSLSLWQNVCQRTSTASITACLQDVFHWFGQNVKGRVSKFNFEEFFGCHTMERNQRVLQHKANSMDQVLLRTVNFMRDFFSSKRGINSCVLNRSLCAIWGLSKKVLA